MNGHKDAYKQHNTACLGEGKYVKPTTPELRACYKDHSINTVANI